MKAFIAVLCLATVANAGVLTSVVAPATVISRAPSLDSAVIQIATPVAVSYNAPTVVAAPALTRTVIAGPALARTVVAHPGLTLAAPATITTLGSPAGTVRIA